MTLDDVAVSGRRNVVTPGMEKHPCSSRNLLKGVELSQMSSWLAYLADILIHLTEMLIAWSRMKATWIMSGIIKDKWEVV